MLGLELKTPALALVVIALALAVWLFFDTERALVWLSLNRRRSFATWEVVFFRVDAAVVGLGTAFILVANLARRL